MCFPGDPKFLQAENHSRPLLYSLSYLLHKIGGIGSKMTMNLKREGTSFAPEYLPQKKPQRLLYLYSTVAHYHSKEAACGHRIANSVLPVQTARCPTYSYLFYNEIHFQALQTIHSVPLRDRNEPQLLVIYQSKTTLVLEADSALWHGRFHIQNLHMKISHVLGPSSSEPQWCLPTN